MGNVAHVMGWQRTDLSVEWGLMEAKSDTCFKQFLVIFGHRWVAMVACGVIVRGLGDEGQMLAVSGGGWTVDTFLWPMGCN
jgi:hypothetical protein